MILSVRFNCYLFWLSISLGFLTFNHLLKIKQGALRLKRNFPSVFACTLFVSVDDKLASILPYHHTHYALEEFFKVLGFSDNEAEQGDDFYQYSRGLNGEIETLTLNTDLFDSNNEYRIKRLPLPEVKELIHMTVKPVFSPFADFGDEPGELPF